MKVGATDNCPSAFSKRIRVALERDLTKVSIDYQRKGIAQAL